MLITVSVAVELIALKTPSKHARGASLSMSGQDASIT